MAGAAESGPSEVTSLLSRMESGGLASPEAERLAEAIYGELRRLAARVMADERADHTLQPTALVHEAWLKLVGQERVEWRGRAHFLAIAAQSMRRILVDHARGKQRDKRGGGRAALALDPELVAAADGKGGPSVIDLVALDDALAKLKGLSGEQAELVELRFFGGLSMEGVSEVLGVSLSTAEREWRFARAWLLHELREGA